MSGKARYGGFSVSRQYATDTTAEETRSAAATTAATAATDAAVQGSWAQYVQNLVSERIATRCHDGRVGRGLPRSAAGGEQYSAAAQRSTIGTALHDAIDKLRMLKAPDAFQFSFTIRRM
jgi:hypothetical protein